MPRPGGGRWAVLLVLAASCRQVLDIEDLTMRSAGRDAVGTESGSADAGGTGPQREAFQSCRGVSAFCGLNRNEDCCAVRRVDGGLFFRTGSQTYPATLTAFVLDRFEVNAARVESFIVAGYGTQLHPPGDGLGAHPGIQKSGWDPTWNALLPPNTQVLREAVSCNSQYDVFAPGPDADRRRAANCLDWYTAFAFCAWDGGRLPTEAEWEYSAAAGSQQRPFPWGTERPDPTRASYGCTTCTFRNILPVGILSPGDGFWGHADLSGNLYEWTLDAFGNLPERCVDCANLGASATRVIRGGSFASGEAVIRTDSRSSGNPTSSATNVGVRCARDL